MSLSTFTILFIRSLGLIYYSLQDGELLKDAFYTCKMRLMHGRFVLFCFLRPKSEPFIKLSCCILPCSAAWDDTPKTWYKSSRSSITAWITCGCKWRFCYSLNISSVGMEDVLRETNGNPHPTAHLLLSIETMESSLVSWWQRPRLWGQTYLALPLLLARSWASPFTSKARTQMFTFQSYFENCVRSHI